MISSHVALMRAGHGGGEARLRLQAVNVAKLSLNNLYNLFLLFTLVCVA